MKKKLLFLVPLFLIFTQCKKDDDDTEYVIREYSDQVNVDHQLLEDYYYKSSPIFRIQKLINFFFFL